MSLFFGIFLLGFQLGASACAVSCMPVMTPILLANSDGKKGALAILARFFSAKILAYALISLTAFFGAAVFKSAFIDTELFLRIGALFVGGMGVLILYRAFVPKRACSSTCTQENRLGIFAAGFFGSFSFCLPIWSLIALSSLSASPIVSLLYGFFFGLGTVLVPFMLFYFMIFRIASESAKKLAKYKKELEIFSGAVLVFIGVATYFGYYRF